MQRLTTLANELWPLLAPRVAALAGGGGGGATAPAPAYVVGEHDLGGSLHKGPLRDDQGPQFLLVDGSRALTGNLLVSAGVTIDGVDLSVHAADPDAHHARLHGILSTSDHSVTGSLFQVVGLAGTNTLGLLTPSADVRTGAAESLLKSNAAGELGVKGMAVGSAMILSGNGNVGAFPDIQFTGDAFLAAEGSLYVSLDSDNNAASGAALIVGHNSPTTVGFVELFRFSDAGTLRITAAAPTISTAANDLTIAPANRTLFADDKQIRSQTHTAGFLGAGFSISWPLSGKAHLDIRSAYMEELEVTAFQADVMRVRVGEDFLGQGMGTTSAAFVTPAIGASVRVTFENNPTIAGQIFMPDEWVMLQVIQRGTGLLAKQIWGQVSGYIDEGNDQQSWLFTMRSGPVGLRVNKSSNALAFGFSGSGYIHHNVLRSANGPWTRYATWSGANPYTPANRRVHTQAGNLNGLVDISTDRYGIAAGNNLGLTPATGFSGFTVDDTGGLRLFSTAIALYSGAVVTVDIQPTGNVKLGTNIANAINTTFEFVAATGALRVGPGANAPTLNWTGTTLALRNSAGTDVILLDSSGASYFAGVMTIGSAGEIRQGTGTLGSNYTGLRLWRDGSIGRIGGYKSNVLQWYGDTLGELRAGTGLLALADDGLGLARYQTSFGVPIAGTESRAAVAWWDNIDSRTGAPLARIYASRSDAGSGAYPALSIEVDPANADADLRPSIWLIGNRAGFAPTLWLGNIYNVVGLPGIYPSRNATTLADTVQFSGSLYFEAHLLRDPANADLDVGTADNPFRTIYATNVIATSISGTAMSGQEWEYTGSMQIDATSASNTILTVTNSGAGRADLNVDRNITLGGTVDGVDVAAFYTAYGTHTHAHSALTGIGANDHHAQAHVLATAAGLGADHTMSGATAGHVLRASSATAAAFAQLGHGDLGGVMADQHHAQQHAITGSDHTVTGSQYQLVGLTGTNTLGLLTPSSNPGDTSAILRTNAGALTLAQLTIRAAGYLYMDGVLDFGVNTMYEDATYLQVTGSKAVRFAQNIGNANWTVYSAGGADFRGNVSVLAGADLTVAGSGAYAGSTVLFADASGGNVGILCTPDPQFALDVAGPARAQYFIGPHAIQLRDVLLLAHFDGRTPFETNFAGEPNGHMGQIAGVAGSVIYRPGKFGKAVQTGAPTINLCPNPSFEINTTGWVYVDANTSGSMARTAMAAHVGAWSLQLYNNNSGEDDFATMSIAGLSANTAYTISAYALVSDEFVAGAALNRGLFAYDSAASGATQKTTTITAATGGEWVRHAVTVTMSAAPGVLVIRLYAPRGRVFWDAVQVEAGGGATGYADGSMPGHTWAGAAHASASTRPAATYVTYPTAGNIRIDRGTVMAWVLPYSGFGAATWWRVDNSGAGGIILRSNGVNLEAFWGTGSVAAVGAVAAGAWMHVAVAQEAGTLRLYVNGAQVASGPSVGFTGIGAEIFVGTADGASAPFAGLFDDFCILPYAADANMIRAVYESDAPVFAETSRYGFRATPKNLVWADDDGLWVRGANGDPVLGVYAGEAASKAWAGFALGVGDVAMGYNAAGSAALLWSKAVGKFGFYGNGNSTPQVEIAVDGSLVAGGGAVKLDISGFTSYADGGAEAIDIDSNGIYMRPGGPKTNIWGTLTGSRIRTSAGEFFEADAVAYVDGVEVDRELHPLVLRSVSGYAGWVEISAHGYYDDLDDAAKIILSQGGYIPEYSVNAAGFWNSTRIIHMMAETIGLSADRLRIAGPATSAAAVGAYAGKIKVTINGTDRWIPYYAS